MSIFKIKPTVIRRKSFLLVWSRLKRFFYALKKDKNYGIMFILYESAYKYGWFEKFLYYNNIQ